MNREKSIVVIHNEVKSDSAEDEKDVLVQVQAVTDSLKNLGFRYFYLPVSLDIKSALQTLAEKNAGLVFNLVESLDRSGRLIHLIPTILDSFKIAYTGVCSEAMFCTTSKILSKTLFSLYGIPTSEWQACPEILTEGVEIDPPYILKPVWEDASSGIDDSCVFFGKDELVDRVKNMDKSIVDDFFVEQFVGGREFNISIIGPNRSPEILPPAEIIFKNYPPDKPEIVCYKAKWDKGSFEYKHTVRNLDFTENDMNLINKIKTISVQCWRRFRLNGYARVDMRVDKCGNPLVLEINPNPCISPDSGFVAAAEKAGYTYDNMVEKIITEASERLNII